MNNTKEVIVKNLKPLKSWLSGVEKELIERGEAPKYPITFLPKLNNKIWGLRYGLNVLAGRPSNMKSSIALMMANSLSRSGLPVMYMSLEDDVETIVEKLFCQCERVDNKALQMGRFKYNEDYKDKWENFRNNLPSNLLITCNIGSDFNHINYILSALKPMPAVVIVDYIGAIRITGNNERLALDEYIRKFREICVLNKICGVLVAQINREVRDSDDRMPTMEMLKSTGKLEEHCDLCLLCHWPYHYTRKSDDFNKFNLIVAKNKRGATGMHSLRVIPENYYFEEWSEDDPNILKQVQAVMPEAGFNND